MAGWLFLPCRTVLVLAFIIQVFSCFQVGVSLPIWAGKRVFVTGSSGGIGAGIAKKFASQGADVLVHYHTRRQGAFDTAQAIVDEGTGTCAGIVQCDFRHATSVQDMFTNVIDTIWNDGFDILVNNAGLVTKMAIQDDDDALSIWQETMAVNLHAPLQLSRLAHSRLRNRPSGGVIVNVSSIHGERNVEWMTAYAVSKAALDALTRGLALEYAADNIRVNAVAPGIVPVERTAKALASPGTVELWQPHLPLGRMGSIDEIADATLSLCTNTWMTGTVLKVDGGMMARSNMPIRPRPQPTHDDRDVIYQGVVFEEFPQASERDVS